jgi:hypothetical protein
MFSATPHYADAAAALPEAAAQRHIPLCRADTSAFFTLFAVWLSIWLPPRAVSMKAECHACLRCTATLQLSLHARYAFVASRRSERHAGYAAAADASMQRSVRLFDELLLLRHAMSRR